MSRLLVVELRECVILKLESSTVVVVVIVCDRVVEASTVQDVQRQADMTV